MKIHQIFLFTFILIYLFIAEISPVISAPPPEEVKRIKEESPLHVIGEVISDDLLQDTSQGYPSQLRSMNLNVHEIIKKPDDLDLEPGESLEIVYSYVPSWVPMEGGAKMDMMVGDQIEIWLKKDGHVWRSSLGGETVDHLIYVQPRIEPIPEPFSHWLKRSIEKNMGYIISGGFIIFLLIVLGIAYKMVKI